jgi:hypothetical protein
MSTTADFRDNLALLSSAGRLLRIQRVAREAGAEISMDQAAKVLRLYELWLEAAEPEVPISMRLRVRAREQQ